MNKQAQEKLEALKDQARKELNEHELIVDGCFEGDYETWLGVYARPKDKPTALDPMTAEEARLQDAYAVNGFKQDFSEWVEWDIVNNHLENFC